MEIVPASDFPEQLPTKDQQRAFARDILSVYKKLDEYEDPPEPTESYLERRSGRYVRVIEDTIDKALALGMIELASSLSLALVRLTKVGRAKAEVSLAGVPRLRDEADLSEVGIDDLARAIGRKVDGE